MQTFWRSELQSELERNVNETHHLETTRKNLERALAETEGPMRVNAECIYNRSGGGWIVSNIAYMFDVQGGEERY